MMQHAKPLMTGTCKSLCLAWCSKACFWLIIMTFQLGALWPKMEAKWWGSWPLVQIPFSAWKDSIGRPGSSANRWHSPSSLKCRRYRSSEGTEPEISTSTRSPTVTLFAAMAWMQFLTFATGQFSPSSEPLFFGLRKNRGKIAISRVRSLCVKVFVCKSFCVWKLLCVKASVREKCLCVKASVCESVCV